MLLKSHLNLSSHISDGHLDLRKLPFTVTLVSTSAFMQATNGTLGNHWANHNTVDRPAARSGLWPCATIGHSGRATPKRKVRDQRLRGLPNLGSMTRIPNQRSTMATVSGLIECGCAIARRRRHNRLMELSVPSLARSLRLGSKRWRKSR